MTPVTLTTDAFLPEAMEQISRVSTLEVVSVRDRDAYLDAVSRASAVVVRQPIPTQTFDVGSQLRIIARHGAGVDFIPVREATRAGVVVTNVPASNQQTVAEHVIRSMLALARNSMQIEHELRRSGWHAARELANSGLEIEGTTVGLIGTGRVATRVGQIATAAFGMDVLSHSVSGRTAYEFGLVSLEQLLAESDFVIVACELNERTRGLISADMLGRMKSSAYLINVARGAVVDNDAVAMLLTDGRIAGAALDVFDELPLPPVHPLYSTPRLLMTPHVAGISVQSMRRMGGQVVDQVIDALEGRIPRNVVNPEVLTHERVRRWATSNHARKDDR